MLKHILPGARRRAGRYYPLTMFQHDFPFDPTYGYDEAALLQVPAPEGPADFDDFWRATFDEAMAPPLNLAVEPIGSPREGVELFHVSYDSLGGVRIGGWLTRPRGVEPVRAVVVGHGYGGRAEPGFDLPGPPAATIQYCARGFHRSARADLPNESTRHVTHGIESRETYIHRGCVADTWRAASALIEWMSDLAPTLQYHGGSFGGGIGALALPWDARFTRAFLDVPSFGNYPLRVTLPCNGSGHWVTRYWEKHPEALDVLAYFDAATAARRITIPVLVAVAKFDPAVAPPSQCATYNGLAGPKELVWRRSGHFEAPTKAEDDRLVNEAVARFLG